MFVTVTTTIHRNMRVDPTGETVYVNDKYTSDNSCGPKLNNSHHTEN